MWRRSLQLGLLSALLAVSLGCTYLQAHGQVARLESMRILNGRLSGTQGGSSLALAVESTSGRIVDFYQLDGDGTFTLMVSPGSYRVLAFRDLNGDRIHDPGEPWAEHAGTVTTGERLVTRGLDVTLPETGGTGPGLAIDLADPDLDSNVGFGGPPIGTVASLDDPRFARENAQLGLWKPVDFLTKLGGGVFLLEPYRPDRTPIVFVHGAAGTPRDFEYLIEQLDRSLFQPWVLHYPSALRLEPVADFLNIALAQLRAEHGFERVFVVAHSMGGLVSRAFFNEFIVPADEDWAPLLVTLSTPWEGHAAAQSGVERSPVVLPSWRDMASSSVFIDTLFETPLGDGTEFHLFFGFEGHRARAGTTGANDGSVAVASQLGPAAQREAIRVYGFPDNHTSILRNPDVSDALNGILETALSN